MVFYRKYRPQTIEDLDNLKVRETLSTVLSGSSVPHAFLFTGPRGLGKTSAARIIAKVVNCEKRKNIEPCNKCDQCLSITNGTNLDILEIDGASNRGIDEIRDLREKIRLSPVSSKKKVYIIDEVHMLTTEAFNALLKTLEEPPAHALFILCTTEPHKVPQTIMSRCFHISFTKATSEELIRSFLRIVKNEKINIEKDALELIATMSDGSFRDGSKMLEEITSLANGEKITIDLVSEKLKISNIFSYQEKLLDFLQKKDIKSSIQLVLEIVNEGIDIKYFIEQLIGTLHKNLLIKLGVEKGKELEFSIEEIKKIIQLLTKAHIDTKFAVLPQLPLELAIVEFGIEQPIRGPALGFPPASAPSSEASFSEVRAVGSPSTQVTTQIKNDSKTENNLLQKLIEKIKTENFSIAGVLRGCTISRYDNKEVVIEAAYKFHKEKLEEKNNLELIEKIINEITGKKEKVLILLKKKEG